ncbi:MAG: hypothetical protein ACMXYF_05655 [Candidatus Woesearchaeota archaeon]
MVDKTKYPAHLFLNLNAHARTIAQFDKYRHLKHKIVPSQQFWVKNIQVHRTNLNPLLKQVHQKTKLTKQSHFEKIDLRFSQNNEKLFVLSKLKQLGK